MEREPSEGDSSSSEETCYYSFIDFLKVTLGYADAQWLNAGYPINTYSVGAIQRNIYAVGGANADRVWGALKASGHDPFDLFHVDKDSALLADEPNFGIVSATRYSWLSNTACTPDSRGHYLNPRAELDTHSAVFQHALWKGSRGVYRKVQPDEWRSLKFRNLPARIEHAPPDSPLPEKRLMCWIYQLQIADFADAAMTALTNYSMLRAEEIFENRWADFLAHNWLNAKEPSLDDTPRWNWEPKPSTWGPRDRKGRKLDSPSVNACRWLYWTLRLRLKREPELRFYWQIARQGIKAFRIGKTGPIAPGDDIPEEDKLSALHRAMKTYAGYYSNWTGLKGVRED